MGYNTDMSTVKEIESAIEDLPRDQFFQLIDWVRNRFDNEWDRQIEDDVRAGRLDHVAEEALTEYRAGRTTPFPPDEQSSDQ